MQWGNGDRPRLAVPLGSAAYLSLLVTILDAQSVHGPDDGCQGLDGVAVDDRLVLFHVLPGEAIFVDNPREKPHTSDECTVLTRHRERQACGAPGPWSPQTSLLASLRVRSNLDAVLLSCCLNTIESEGEIYPNYRKGI